MYHISFVLEAAPPTAAAVAPVRCALLVTRSMSHKGKEPKRLMGKRNEMLIKTATGKVE
jgi:hypothetical protein